jgi:hypothetical protein
MFFEPLSTVNFAKFFVYVELNQFSLDLGNQIAVVFVDYKPNWATAPCSGPVEVRKPTAMLFVLSTKHHKRASVEL